MEHSTYTNAAGGFSMRRTLLTLLGAVFAFGILTVSYATAEFPEVAGVETGADATVR